MKKLLLVLLLVLLVVSCTKDEDEKVDTSTFTGLYNDTVWLYKQNDQEVAYRDDTTESQSYYYRIIDNELIELRRRSRFSPTNDVLNECENNINVISEGINEYDQNVTFEVNTPEMLIVVSSYNDGVDKDYYAVKLEVVPQDNNFFRMYEAEDDSEFNINDAKFLPITINRYSEGVLELTINWLFEKVDLKWGDLLDDLIDCVDNIGA